MLWKKANGLTPGWINQVCKKGRLAFENVGGQTWLIYEPNEEHAEQSECYCRSPVSSRDNLIQIVDTLIKCSERKQ